MGYLVYLYVKAKSFKFCQKMGTGFPFCREVQRSLSCADPGQAECGVVIDYSGGLD
jgi:hypothetical protein